MNTKVAKKQNNKGFTLIELIVVIAIIAVLASILAPQYLRYVEKSRISADQSTANELVNVCKTAAAEEDVYNKLTGTEVTAATWNSDKNGSGIQGFAPFDEAINTTFTSDDLAKGPKSNTYKAQTFTVKAKVDTNGTVLVQGSWD